MGKTERNEIQEISRTSTFWWQARILTNEIPCYSGIGGKPEAYLRVFKLWNFSYKKHTQKTPYWILKAKNHNDIPVFETTTNYQVHVDSFVLSVSLQKTMLLELSLHKSMMLRC